MELTKSLILILIAISIAVCGQLTLKKTMSEVGVIEVSTQVNYIDKAKTVLKQPLLYVGGCLYVLGMVVWLVVLSRVDLSFAYPMLSVSYVLIMVISAYMFHEPITLNRVIGTFLIIGGVIFITRS